MNLKISDENAQFFRQIWTILGIQSILKSDLIYKISYKLNLPYKPTTLVKKIKDAVSQGILTEKDKLLYLNENDLKEIQKEKRNFEESQKMKMQVHWDRIEESIDPWMSVIEEKTKKKDAKSLTLNAIVRSIMTDDILKKGTAIPAKKFHISLENDVISGSIENDAEENLVFQIDLGEKTIDHNCQEFIGNLSEKVLCKHFYRIFMYVKTKDLVLSKNLLISLHSKKEEWVFKNS